MRCCCACAPSASTSATCSTCSASTRATPARRAATRRAWWAGAGARSAHAAFGLGHAPLACVARARAAPLLARKPATLSFEQACTLPVTWSTTHAAVERAGLRAGRAIVVQAAAGGVGLKAVEYAQWLRASCSWARRGGRTSTPSCARRASARCAARATAPPLRFGACARLLAAARSHAVLNSLSLDFIAASFASLGEGGAFEEIGKRGIWASDRQPGIGADDGILRDRARRRHGARPAVDAWRARVLLAARARRARRRACRCRASTWRRSTRWRSARCRAGSTRARSSCASCARARLRCDGVHVVTGGTGGLGLLTGRWLAQRGARASSSPRAAGARARRGRRRVGGGAGERRGAVRTRRSSGATRARRRTSLRLVAVACVVALRRVARGGRAGGRGAAQAGRASASPRVRAQGARRVECCTRACAHAPLRACRPLLVGGGAARRRGAGQLRGGQRVPRRARHVAARARGRGGASVQWGRVGGGGHGGARRGERAGWRRWRRRRALRASGWRRGWRRWARRCGTGAPSVLGVVPVTWSRLLGRWGGARLPVGVCAQGQGVAGERARRHRVGVCGVRRLVGGGARDGEAHGGRHRSTRTRR